MLNVPSTYTINNHILMVLWYPFETILYAIEKNYGIGRMLSQ